MKKIPLTRGHHAVVDDADYAWLSRYKWHYTTNGYAARRTSKAEGLKVVGMHSFILGLPGGDVDHRDENKLNNSRLNLRPATRSQNSANRGLQSNNTTGYKGVYLTKDSNSGRYQAYIKKMGKKTVLGRFDTAELAAKAYNKAAITLFGEFAKLNKVA